MRSSLLRGPWSQLSGGVRVNQQSCSFLKVPSLSQFKRNISSSQNPLNSQNGPTSSQVANPRRRRMNAQERLENIQKLLHYVFQHATEGDADSVVQAMDEFNHKHATMMHVGSAKGRLLDEVIQKHHPKVMIELGAFCGYSAVRFARWVRNDPEAHFFSFEVDPLHAAIATKVVELAGLRDKVTVIVGSFSERIDAVRQKNGIKHVDFFFIDHMKDLYLPDLKLIEEKELLRQGSVVVADNIIMPGAPAYAEYIKSSPLYETQLLEATMECSDGQDRKDAVAVSVFKG